MATQITKWLAFNREFDTQAEAEAYERRRTLVVALQKLNRGKPTRLDMDELAKRFEEARPADLASIRAALQDLRQS